MESLEKKQVALRKLLRASAPLVVAYSGGVDSAFLLASASETLADRSLGIIADSPSLPRQALTEALQLAQHIGAKVEVIQTDEMADANYTSNPVNRCYFCKASLFRELEQLARRRGFRTIAYGENFDDAAQFRPGREAAEEFRVIAPLKEVGLTKSEIRALSRVLRLPTADAPAQPCLSSRIPHGTPVTVVALGMIEKAEIIMREFGFHIFRVRHHMQSGRPWARLEIAADEMPQLASRGRELRQALRNAGYKKVRIDPRGYRAPGI